jgi:cyclopropane-fatty-acyl-phospholipid synthase
MSTINAILAKNILPDAMIRLGIRQRLAETLRENKQPTVEASARLCCATCRS